MNLSEKDEKFLLLVEKNIARIFLYYIAVGFLLCLAIAGLIFGIKFEAQKGFFYAFFFGALSFFLLVISRLYQKFYTIIKKMKQYIKELEMEREKR